MRNKTAYTPSNLPFDLQVARGLYQRGSYFEAFDVYEEIVRAFPDFSVEVLAEVYDCYQKMPDQSRYMLYQGRHIDFKIGPTDQVLDIGSGHLPFPLATHLADVTLTEHSVGRAGAPFKYIAGKPVYECSVEATPFADKQFDFVFCSHVLEHVYNPEKACRELMRIGKRGYIETPTRGKDTWLNTAKKSNHRWAVELLNNRLVFTEYTALDLEGLGCDILMNMHMEPQTKREKALSALIYLKAPLINTMMLWEESFEFEVRRLKPPQPAGCYCACVAT